MRSSSSGFRAVWSSWCARRSRPAPWRSARAEPRSSHGTPGSFFTPLSCAGTRKRAGSNPTHRAAPRRLRTRRTSGSRGSARALRPGSLESVWPTRWWSASGSRARPGARGARAGFKRGRRRDDVEGALAERTSMSAPPAHKVSGDARPPAVTPGRGEILPAQLKAVDELIGRTLGGRYRLPGAYR